jgi:hypothetical protein
MGSSIKLIIIQFSQWQRKVLEGCKLLGLLFSSCHENIRTNTCHNYETTYRVCGLGNSRSFWRRD